MNNMEILQEAIENNKLTIFVGAGVSMGAGLPSWGDLIAEMKKDLNTKEEDYLKIAEEYFNKFGEDKYCGLIKKNIPDKVEDFNKKDTVHKLIFDLKPKNVITTNYDMLLEDTTERYGYVYDVISTDEHLVDTVLPSHIIKMHGEFNTKNIVLKESDYDNYSKNFPLIENYIKSILSTNTILFLGYGYGDSTLHNIVKWLRDASDKYPPMFLTTFEEDKEKMENLKESGIDTIILEEVNEKYKEIENEYSCKIATFLDGLINPLDIYIDNFSDKDIVDFIYSKLKPLEEQNIVLPQQIQMMLSNCGFNYIRTADNKNLMLINFYDQLLTFDYEENIRKVYKKFKTIILKEDNDTELNNTIIKIYQLLIKANIDGVCISEHCENNFRTFNFKDEIYKNIKVIENKIYNFDFLEEEINDTDILDLIKKAFFDYQQYKFLEAFTLTKEKIIPLCLKEKNYIQLFFAMFNYNRLLRELKSRLPTDNWNEKEHVSYDIEEQYYQLPRKIQAVLKGIKPFVTFEYLNRFAFNISVELEKKNIKSQQIKNKQLMFSLDKNVTENYSKHKSFISFVLNNCLMYEASFEFNQINKNLVEISLLRQIQEDKVELDKLELFSAIKYISHKDFKNIFRKYYEKNSDEKGKFFISINNLDWIIFEVLPNIVKLMISENKVINYPFFNEFQNIIFILSLVKLEKKYLEKIIEEISKTINNSIGSTDSYELLNNFLIIQYSLYKDEMEVVDLRPVLSMIIRKILDDKVTGYDFYALEDNSIHHLFGYMDEYKQTFFDIKMLENLLEKFSTKLDLKYQVSLAKSFLLKLYNVSDKQVQVLIADYMNKFDYDAIKIVKQDTIIDIDIDIDIDLDDNYGFVLSVKLLLVILGINSIQKENYVELGEYLEKSTLYRYLEEITNQLKYLVEKLNIKELETIYLLYQEKNDTNQKLTKRPKSIF